MPAATARDSKRKDLGDFQTPPALVAEILDALERTGGRPGRVLEPTCGRGHFLAGLLGRPDPPREAFGCEIQPEHAEAARSIATADHPTRLVVRVADAFAVDFAREPAWESDGPLLVVGNLPWVTTAALGASGGTNGPGRSNVKNLRGLAARTGEANFDIAESLWLKLVRELEQERPTIALLCKSAVARLVLGAIHRADLPITRATLWRVDARRWFRASVDACLLRVEVGPGPKATEAAVFADLADPAPASILGLGAGPMVADLAAYRRFAFADGQSPLTWRQGVKHDAAAVMELTTLDDARLANKSGEIVDVEPVHVFPLMKGSDLGGLAVDRPARAVLVTQQRLGEETRGLERTAPRLWAYLSGHADVFDRRKSSIYRGRPPFCLFGIGDSTFAPWKVAVSGLHKTPRFVAIGPVEGRPTLFDDTCYFLPCLDRDQAEVLAATLNSPASLGLLRSLIFEGAKRPVTKALLQRLDLKALLAESGRGHLWRDEWATP